MTSEVQPGETPTNPPSETPAETPVVNAAPETGKSVEQQIADMQAALKKANAEAAKYRKAAEALEQADKARADAELSEMERLKKQLDEIKAEADRLRRAELQRQAAEKHKLPASLATRLQGETLEELEADAEELAKTLPKPTTPVSPTNPGANGQPVEETDAQKKARLFGTPTDPFDAAFQRKLGGGVIFRNEE